MKKNEQLLIDIINRIDLKRNEEYRSARRNEYRFFKVLCANYRNLQPRTLRTLKDACPFYSWYQLKKHLSSLGFSRSSVKYIKAYRSTNWLFGRILDLKNFYNEFIDGNLKRDYLFLKKAIEETRSHIRMKFLLFTLIYDDPVINASETFKKKLEDFLRYASYGNCRYFLEESLNTAKKIYPDKFRQSRTRGENTESEEEPSDNDQFDQENEDEEDLLTDEEFTRQNYLELIKQNLELERKYNDAQAMADLFQQRLKDYKNEMEELKKQSEERIKLSLFKNLNSVSSNFFLDNFYMAKKLYSEIEDSDEISSIEGLEEILYIIPLFSEFLEMNSVSPILNVGEIFQIEEHEVENYIYHGTPFKEGDDKKWVKVRAPGWKYNDVIFSKPEVIEIKKEGD